MRNKKLFLSLLAINLAITLVLAALILPGQLAPNITAYGQQEGVELVGPDSGEWIIALLDPKNTDLAADACAILSALADGSANQAGQFATSEAGPTVSLALLERYSLIEWTGSEWAPLEFAAGEAAKFCP